MFFNRLFGDSSAVVHYRRWIGYRLNKIVQTGSNFGIDQRHDNPFLCDIGSGTMVSGGLKIVNETMSNKSFKLGTVKIGDENYLGNYVSSPRGQGRRECLIATKALVPIDGPVRENIGLLGSPPFEIPRATSGTSEMAKMDEATRRQRLRAKNRYNLGLASCSCSAAGSPSMSSASSRSRRRSTTCSTAPPRSWSRPPWPFR